MMPWEVAKPRASRASIDGRKLTINQLLISCILHFDSTSESVLSSLSLNHLFIIFRLGLLFMSF